jgi:hypothetical protein
MLEDGTCFEALDLRERRFGTKAATQKNADTCGGNDDGSREMDWIDGAHVIRILKPASFVKSVAGDGNGISTSVETLGYSQKSLRDKLQLLKHSLLESA